MKNDKNLSKELDGAASIVLFAYYPGQSKHLEIKFEKYG